MENEEIYCEVIGEEVYCDVIGSTTDIPQLIRQSQTNASQSCPRSSQMSMSRKQVILISIVMTAFAILLVLSIVFMAMFLINVGKSKPCVCQSDLANVNSYDDGEKKCKPDVTKAIQPINCTGVNEQTNYTYQSPKGTGCAELYQKGAKSDGVYTIDPDGFGAFNVRCDMTTSGGGWTIFQRRIDGSVDFFLDWSSYKEGFGSFCDEFWLGLDKINRLTESDQDVLRVDMEDFENETRYAEYKIFHVSNETDNYKLTIGRYSGNAGDSLAYSIGMKFSTRDVDNDKSKANCAKEYKGAWWYKKCHHSNLNGQYLRGAHTSFANGVNWYRWKGYYYSLKKIEMKIRPRSF